MTSEETAFDEECEVLERALEHSIKHYRVTKRGHRIVRYAVGVPAVAFTATASASAFSDRPEAAGWLALAGTVLGLVYASIDPIRRQAVNEMNEFDCESLEREVRCLCRLESRSKSHAERVEALKSLIRRYREVGAKIPSIDLGSPRE